MIFFCQKQLFFKFFVFYSTATLFKNDGHIKKKADTLSPPLRYSTFSIFLTLLNLSFKLIN